MTDLAKLQLRALARKLIDDIDEMYSVRLSPAQYDDSVAMAEKAFAEAAPLIISPHWYDNPKHPMYKALHTPYESDLP